MFSGYIYKCTTRHQTWEDFAGKNMGYLWVTMGLPTRRTVWWVRSWPFHPYDCGAPKWHVRFGKQLGKNYSIPWPPWPWAFEGQLLRQVHLAMLLGQTIISPQISPCVPCALAVAGLTWLKTGSKDGINKYEFDHDSSTLIITEIDIGSNQLSNPILTIHH